jgi:hypothetical protein
MSQISISTIRQVPIGFPPERFAVLDGVTIQVIG